MDRKRFLSTVERILDRYLLHFPSAEDIDAEYRSGPMRTHHLGKIANDIDGTSFNLICEILRRFERY